MKHMIIGTAGHIDHGKTTLIKALTGRETDRLKEEKKRGISIELGFTYFDLPNGLRAGIIDVPGHEKFVKNMLAGVIGIDLVLLVVAADEGVMPQTLEHLAILNLLGVEKGIIALTKADLVEEEWMELVEEEIREEIRGTFLENSPIIRVSSTKRQGIDDIIQILEDRSRKLDYKKEDETPRLPVDRSFIVSGFGTIVTGTLLSGSLKKGDEVEVFPKGNISRIRTLQVHDEDAEVAYAGQRVAMNLAGIKKEDVERGSVVAPIDSMKKTMMLDVKVGLLESLDRTIPNRTRLKLYLGTKELLCRIILLDRDELSPGEEAYAQLRLEEETVAKMKDKFIIRFYSPMFTIGGGEILEPNPTKKKRFDSNALRELEVKDQGSFGDILENIINEKSKEFPSIKELTLATSMKEESIKDEVDKLAREDRVKSFTLTEDSYIIHKEYFKELQALIIDELEQFHKNYSLRVGMPKEELRSKTIKNASPRLGEIIIDKLIREGILEQKSEFIRLKDFKIQYSDKQLKIKDKIIRIFAENAYIPPKMGDLNQLIREKEIEINEVVNSLIDSGDIVRLNREILILKESYDNSLVKLKRFFESQDSISIGEFRDILNTNRRVSIALLEYFDEKKITKRDGDKRILMKGFD